MVWNQQAVAKQRTRAEYHSCGSLELEFFLWPTVSQPVHLGIGPPFGTLDQILSCSSFSSDNYFILGSKAPSLTRKQVCSLQCSHSLVRSLTPNHTLLSHLRLCSLFVASYDSQGLRWRYSNPPPHGVLLWEVPTAVLVVVSGGASSSSSKQ
jgi:hypothetical protein